ncbi:MAG: rhodanese-related sulfurtransferase [Chitinophagaceae bacterium]|nr:rhodanese-related sulfurtransferase [Chitinophagaceae bacterium]
MAVLHNRVSQAELKKLLNEEKEHRTTISFYHYFSITDPKQLRDDLYKSLHALKVFGRIYVAHEGINAQVSVPESNFIALKKYLYSIEALNNIRLNIAVDDDGKSFWVLKIKVREKIVADGITDPGFSMDKKGRYVNAVQMNALLKDENTIVIDMRNHYEYEVGHFVKAIEVPSDTFREQLPMAVEMMKDKKDKNIIMYCTGGIRCEKASAYMMHHGFNNVFDLEGGIINYAREAKEKGLQSEFIGKNFVFDDRRGERITEHVIAKCHQCGNTSDTHINCNNDGCHLLFIQCKACAEKYDGCCSEECRQIFNLPLEQQKELRKGIDKGNMIFNKSKQRLRPRLDK